MYYMLFLNFLSNILFYLFIYINSQFNSLLFLKRLFKLIIYSLNLALCLHLAINIHIHIYIYTHTPIYIYIYICTHISICAHTDSQVGWGFRIHQLHHYPTSVLDMTLNNLMGSNTLGIAEYPFMPLPPSPL